MELAGAILAFGGAVSFAAGAASGLWMHAQMMKAPKDGPPRYTMTPWPTSTRSTPLRWRR